MPPNTQMQPTVTNKLPLSRVRRAAADLQRYAPSSLLAVVLSLITHIAVARELTADDLLDVKAAAYRLVAPEQQTLGLNAWWGEEEPDKWTLEVLSKVRPVEVRQGLCSMETYKLVRREGDADFRRLDLGLPMTSYWRKHGDAACDAVDRNDLPDAVAVWPPVPTSDLVRIMDDAEQLLRVASEAQCNEPIMAQVFQDRSSLKLRSLTLVSRAGEGVIYEAFFEWKRNSGPFIYFSLTATSFDVVWNCFGHVDPIGPMPYLE